MVGVEGSELVVVREEEGELSNAGVGSEIGRAEEGDVRMEGRDGGGEVVGEVERGVSCILREGEEEDGRRTSIMGSLSMFRWTRVELCSEGQTGRLSRGYPTMTYNGNESLAGILQGAMGSQRGRKKQDRQLRDGGNRKPETFQALVQLPTDSEHLRELSDT